MCIKVATFLHSACIDGTTAATTSLLPCARTENLEEEEGRAQEGGGWETQASFDEPSLSSPS